MSRNRISQKCKNYQKIRAYNKGHNLLEKEIESIELKQRTEEKATNNFKHYGNNGKAIEEGTQNRLAALPYQLPEKYVLEKDRISFTYGYYEKGTRTIHAQINILSPERLKKIGQNDALDDNIIFEQLPEEIQTNPFYLNGYNIGYNEKKSKGKGRK